MNELIKISYENAERPTVSGRELHEALEVETPYHKWFPRMCEYGFLELEDFWTKMSESTGGDRVPITNLQSQWQKRSVCCREVKKESSSASTS